MAGSSFPTTIGRFKVEALLGAGGMGEVYKAYDATLQRTIAVKTVRPDINNPSFLDRLYREAQAGARLQHPNIVTVFEAGEIDGLVYIAMEYLKGENLAAALERGDLNFEAKIRIVMQILEALQYAHSEGVIHRDIKPANVHRLLDGSIKLLDFGLARMTRADALTQTGTVMGTPYYASPEQLKGETVDPRTDIYSAGVLAYELLTGRRAFDGENLSTVMLKVLSEPPPPMETSWTNTFPEIERIVTRAMAKSAPERYATAGDMRNALAAFMSASREALSSLQAEQTVYAQRAVIEAKALIAKGEVGQARELLSETLRVNPEAVAARSLLKDTMAGSAPTKIHAVPALPSPQPDAPVVADGPTRIRPRTAGAAAAESPADLPTASWAPPSPLVPSPPPRAVEPPTSVVRDTPAPPPPTMTWAFTRRTSAWAFTAAVVVVAATGWLINKRGDGATIPPQVAQVNEPAAAPYTPASPAPAAVAPPDASASPAAPVANPPSAAPVPSPGNQTTPPAAKQEFRAAATTPVAPSTGTPSGTKSAASPPAAPAPTAESPSAKKLFVENASRTLGLRYAMVQQTPGGEAEVTSDTTFHTGDKVRFQFESNVDGYLYLVQEGSSGKWDMLFPNPQINGGVNAVRQGQKYTIPSQGWFVFRDPPGAERAFVFLSREPLNTMPGFKAPVTKNESVGQAVVDDLKSKVKSRDLVFEKDKPVEAGAAGARNQAMFVVNRDELAKSVSATIQLVHQ